LSGNFLNHKMRAKTLQSYSLVMVESSK